MSNYKSKLFKTIATKATTLEESVAQALFEVETGVADLKDSLKHVTVANAREIETVVKGKKKNVYVIYVPFAVLRLVQRIQPKLVPELEKRLKTTVLIVAKRTIQSKWVKSHRSQQRPRNRTLTSVYDSVLEDLCQPAAIIGRRIRHKLDGSVVQKIFLDQNEEAALKDKVESITSVYKKLTTRDIQIEFKPEWHFYTLKKN
jgi:small subunit ribosomal protein S7e